MNGLDQDKKYWGLVWRDPRKNGGRNVLGADILLADRWSVSCLQLADFNLSAFVI